MKDCESYMKRFTTELQILKSPTVQRQKIKSSILQTVTSTELEDWKILDQIINISIGLEKPGVMNILEILEIIREEVFSMQSFTIFIYVYWLLFKNKKNYKIQADWKDYYCFTRDKIGLIQIFNSWITYNDGNPTHQEIIQDSIQMVASIMPNLLAEEKIPITRCQFDSFLIWIFMMKTNTRQEFLSACNLIKLVKQSSLIDMNDYEQKEHILLKRIMQLLGQTDQHHGNLSLFFDPFTIKEKDIEYFCHIYENFIEDLDENHFCNIFIGLTKNGINRQILALILKVSNILLSNQQYYILRNIYQKFILPILAAKMKNCKKVYNEVFAITKFYTLGFLNHLKIGLNGLSCLLDKIDKIQNTTVQNQWIDLSILSCKEDKQMCQQMTLFLKDNNMFRQISGHFISQIKKQKGIWQVTIRSGRKHKKYIETNSVRFKGIVNKKNQCYIISVVQSLLMTYEFPKLLLKFRQQISSNDLKLLKTLRHLFSDLNNKEIKEPISVNGLQKKGPKYFENLQTQEDVHEYLLALFQSIEFQTKKINHLYELFNQIFLIRYSQKIICCQCQYQKDIQKSQSTFIHSFTTTEAFDFVTQTQLQGSICEKCKSKYLIIQRKIISNPKILILHINRFYYDKGSKKILGNRSILRKINNYQLSGFICHKGHSLQSGHYTYYSKIQPLRWIYMNDRSVSEFKLQRQDQQFQKCFKAQNTPYILFYTSI